MAAESATENEGGSTVGSATYVADRAQELLNACIAGLDPSRTGHDVPTRVYRGWGDPPADMNCAGNGSLIVSHRVNSSVNVREPGQSRGIPGRRPGGRSLQVIRYRVSLYRCWPLPAPGTSAPDAATIDAASKGLQVDEWCLTKYLLQHVNAGTLFAGVTARDARVGDAIVLPGKGGAAGVRIDVELNANDSGP